MTCVRYELSLFFHTLDHRPDCPSGEHTYKKQYQHQAEKCHEQRYSREVPDRLQIIAAVYKHQKRLSVLLHSLLVFVLAAVALFPALFQNLIGKCSHLLLCNCSHMRQIHLHLRDRHCFTGICQFFWNGHGKVPGLKRRLL